MNDQEKQKQIDAITEGFETDVKKIEARRDRPPVDEKLRPLKKRIKEIQVDHDYSGDGSPYWDHVFNEGGIGEDSFDGVNEEPIANPDVLAEEDAIHHRPLTSEGELQKEALQQTMDSLTPRQREIMQLLFEGVWTEWKDENGELQAGRVHTEQAVATQLGIAQTTVEESLRGIKTKIRRRYEKLKAERF